jgi:hypothetical protein
LDLVLATIVLSMASEGDLKARQHLTNDTTINKGRFSSFVDGVNKFNYKTTNINPTAVNQGVKKMCTIKSEKICVPLKWQQVTNDHGGKHPKMDL